MKIKVPESPHPRIVIVGGGFGGLELAKKLKNKPFQIVLIDRNNYHTFQPLLYQVATGHLEPDSIATPFRKIFDDSPNVIFRMAEVLEIKPDTKEIRSSIGDLHYDHLVIASGSKTNFFGMDRVQKNAMAMKTVPQALDLRSFFLQNLETAVNLDYGDRMESLLDIVIVGGGPTGVETAGALAELRRDVFPTDYKELDFKLMDIYLIEMGPHLLAGMSEKASNKTKKYLEELGVEVWLNTALESYDGDYAYFNNGKKILTNSLIWTAGVTGNLVEGIDKSHIIKGNRIKINDFLEVEGMDSVYAIGDIAALITERNPTPLPMVAQPAIQQGKLLAKNMQRLSKGKKPLPFRYNDLGAMATIGRNRAVADIAQFKITGFFAWFIWIFVHLMSLVGFRNRTVVFWNWMWSYFNKDKRFRLIIRPYKRTSFSPETPHHV